MFREKLKVKLEEKLAPEELDSIFSEQTKMTEQVNQNPKKAQKKKGKEGEEQKEQAEKKEKRKEEKGEIKEKNKVVQQKSQNSGGQVGRQTKPKSQWVVQNQDQQRTRHQRSNQNINNQGKSVGKVPFKFQSGLTKSRLDSYKVVKRKRNEDNEDSTFQSKRSRK